ncbi:MAG TPA: glycine betaine ABC transporter substrate-binding protein [Burkholderiales bacterium]|nr:glycine betaine ABC transporter substrate-binding protein [Burkholderiales bacterium]
MIGSKRFTESYILGEIATQIVRSAGQTTVHRQGMGNTAILFEALKTGQIHLYPDYSGTVARELLHSDATDLDALNRGLRPLGLAAGLPLGFENTYALAMREERANALGISRISDLAPHAELRLGLSHEFLQRSDGWPGLRARYALPQRAVGLDHGLAYEAIAPGQIDVMDIYSTDAKIGRYHLRVLVDDKNYFPRYDAVFVYRLDVPRRFPLAWAALTKLENSIDAQSMIAMNAKAELEGQSFADVAQAFVSARFGHATASSTGAVWWRRVFGDDFARLTVQHLLLVAVSLALAVLIGVPLGIWAARNEAANQAILAGVGVIQTVPALALLAFLIPVLGRIGIIPALVALFLYALLPIVRNTQSGLRDIAPSLRESAIALGLPDFARLRLIELPLAARAILSGIKTAAVISVGTATIAAFIGAGGYGERIVTGLALNDHALLLAGALPAALLALLVQLLFDLLDRWLISPGLRR